MIILRKCENANVRNHSNFTLVANSATLSRFDRVGALLLLFGASTSHVSCGEVGKDVESVHGD